MPAPRDAAHDESLLHKAQEMCARAGGGLLYLCRFGARLYGLERPDGTSDTDLCGLYLPGVTGPDVTGPGAAGQGGGVAGPGGDAGARPPVLLYSTSHDRRRNAPSDVDIELHPWPGFADRLARCEVKALDLAFSPGNRACVLYRDDRVDELFDDPARHLDARDLKALWAYVQDETGRYGMPGSRRAALWRLAEALPGIVSRLGPRTRLAGALPAVLEAAGDPRHCGLEPGPVRAGHEGGEPETLLQVAGKLHPLNIRLGEFAKRVGQDIRPCLQRLTGAREGTDIDWKAVSHALRALWQHRELLRTGRIRFPYGPDLRGGLLGVKLGLKTFDEACGLLAQAWDEVRALARQAPADAARRECRLPPGL